MFHYDIFLCDMANGKRRPQGRSQEGRSPKSHGPPLLAAALVDYSLSLFKMFIERIQQLETPRGPGRFEEPDRACTGPPQFVGQFRDQQLKEGTNLHLELKVNFLSTFREND